MAITRPVVSTLMPIAALASALMAAGCAQQPPLLNQPLAWTPTNTLDLGVTQGHGTPATVRFEAFTDSAANPALIGENMEQATPRQVTTASAVGPFVSQHLQQLFTQAGYPFGGDDADRVVSGEVRKFFVREGSDYAGSVVLNVRVSDRSGNVLWRGTASGSNQTFGRSYHLDNYQQVLSDSLINAADNLLKDPALRNSLMLSH
ncbi:MAG TPA: hypothetical protein VIC29_11605 [Steroidobacteraceae bacterium]